MLFDGFEAPVSRRLWWFNRSMYMRRVRTGVPEPLWTGQQEEGIAGLGSTDFNSDRPSRYARSRGE